MAAKGGSARQKAASLRKLAAEARLKADRMDTQWEAVAIGEQRVAAALQPLEGERRQLLDDNVASFAPAIEPGFPSARPRQASYSSSRHAPAWPKIENPKPSPPRRTAEQRSRPAGRIKALLGLAITVLLSMP